MIKNNNLKSSLVYLLYIIKPLFMNRLILLSVNKELYT